jgi:murein DD-endopeptidase MepM/ murein hydrolase activator NlpD
MHHDRITSRFFPAVLGIVSAVLLGGTGFGLGSLYAGVVDPAPVAAPMVARAANGPPLAGTPASTPGVGGPEEPVPAPRAAIARQASLWPSTPSSGRPTGPFALGLDMDRPVAAGWVSSHFGHRPDPFTGRPAIHQGLDFAGVDNSAILAVAPGVVTWSGRQRGYGNLIEIDHGRGWVTRYGHNASNLVTVGDYVKPGQTIALMGSTGRATGAHLHFEVLYRGRHQNPARFVPRDA